MRNEVLLNAKTKLNTLKNHSMSIALALDTVAVSCIYTATGTGQNATICSLIQTVALIICGVGGGIRALFGGIALADAKGEGDGPAEHKAQNKIISGLALIAIGITVRALNMQALLGL